MKRFVCGLTFLNVIIAVCPTLAHGGSLYWSEFGVSTGAGDISRADLDGTHRIPLVSGLTNPGGPALDIAGGQMYWAENGAIQRANLDGTGTMQVVSGQNSNGFPALDLVHRQMYWTDGVSGGAGEGDIRRSNLDGSAITPLVWGLNDPRQVKLDLTGGKMLP